MHTYIYMCIFDVLSLLFFGTYFFMCLLIEEHKTHSPFSLSFSRFFHFALLLTTMQIMFNCREAIMDSRSFMKILTLPSTHIPTHTQTHTPCELVTHTITYIAMLLLTELLWRSRTIPQNATLFVELPRAYAISSRRLSTTVSYETFGICVPSPSNKCIRAHNRERKQKNRIPQGLCAFLGWDKSGWKEKNQ